MFSDAVIQEAGRRLLAATPPHSRVILFGSHARGEAIDDEFAARSLLPVEGVTDAILGFHTQQAVEKATKAVLEHGGELLP